MVKVYSTTTCPWCVKAKNYLKSKNVEFENVNVSENPKAREELMEKTKQLAVPVLDINGTIVLGFDKPDIDKALGL